MPGTFDSVKDRINFSEEETKILEYWKEQDAFKTSLELSKDRPEYTFYDGPPFATGTPHYGHLLAGTIKDTVTRYAHQTGHYVSRRFGWDCHGLPVEFEIDKMLDIKGRDDVLKMGVANYNNECRKIVLRYTAEWESTITRLGRWIDFENDYKTMDPEFMESVWWVLKTLFDKGLVYRGWKVMPFSCFCGTPLSNFEAGLNYKDVYDPAAVVSFPLVNDPGVELLAWTTTPWTLPSNVGLCVNAKFEYVKIQDKTRSDRVFVVMEKRLGMIYPGLDKADQEQKDKWFTVLERFTGDKMADWKYTPLFEYFRELEATAFRVVCDPYVTDDGGTGIVHMAPAFGEDDYRVCIAKGIVNKGEGLPCPVDCNGRFTDPVNDYAGRNVKECDNDICAVLKGTGRLIQKDNYCHSYPFCWRSETPLIYKAVPSWFVSVESVKEKLLKNNAQTYWVPSFVKEKRFHNWLTDAKDWAISRNRFWGTPIPIWVSDDGEEMVAVGSVEELYQLSGVRVTDLHKEHVDKITIPSKQGKGDLHRIDEVFDCWFESGSMPYAQLHYPFENKERFEKGFPADFIAEGLDQTRGWFYTLTVLSSCLFDKPAFKNLIVNGLVLAADGKKMSKRLKNYPDPNLIIGNYSADALRLYVINSPVVRAETLKFQEEGVKEVVRGVFLPWYNAFRFFVQCVERWELDNGTNFRPDDAVAYASTNDVDIWILAATQGLVQFVHKEMKAYRLYTVVPRLVSFIEELTNWYVRLNRDRIKGSGDADSNIQGLNVLYEVLLTLTQVMAPFTPFFTEYLYQHLRKLHPNFGSTDPSVAIDTVGRAASVHYLMLPEVNEQRMNPLAESRFKTLQTAVTLCRVARERRKIRNNLPLKNVIVVAANPADTDALQYLDDYFKTEINAWAVQCSNDWENLCVLKTVPNWKDLGKRLGKDMKKVAAAVNALTQSQIVAFMKEGSIELAGYTLTTAEIVVKREFNGDAKRYEASVSDDGSLLIALDTTCDAPVLEELRARTIAAQVQKLRKSAGLAITDKVEIFFQEDGDEVLSAVTKHADSTIKRVKSLPLPASFMSSHACVIAQEVLQDADLSKKKVTLTLTRPLVAVHKAGVAALLGMEDAAAASAATAAIEQVLVSMDYDELMALESHTVVAEGRSVTVSRDQHYFASANDLKAKA